MKDLPIYQDNQKSFNCWLPPIAAFRDTAHTTKFRNEWFIKPKHSHAESAVYWGYACQQHPHWKIRRPLRSPLLLPRRTFKSPRPWSRRYHQCCWWRAMDRLSHRRCRIWIFKISLSRLGMRLAITTRTIATSWIWEMNRSRRGSLVSGGERLYFSNMVYFSPFILFPTICLFEFKNVARYSMEGKFVAK